MKFKYFFEPKRLLFVSTAAAILGIIYSLSTTVINEGNSVAATFEKIVGYNDFLDYGFSNLQGVIVLFLLSLPVMNYYEKNLSKANAYIFSRIKSKSSYFNKKFLCLAFFCLISSMLYFVTKMLLNGRLIFDVNLIICFTDFFLSLFIFSACVCLVSVFAGCVRAYLIMVIIYCALIFSVTVCYYNCNQVFVFLFIILNPCARFMMNWNNEYMEMLNDYQIKLMSPNVSILYFLALVFVYLIVMNITVNKFNMSLRHYDEE